MNRIFFSPFPFKVQVIKGYYKEFFEGFVEGVERWYEVKRDNFCFITMGGSSPPTGGVGEVLPFALACLGSPPPRGSYLFLDKKVTKNQGLDLMSDKFVKALRSPAQAPMKT